MIALPYALRWTLISTALTLLMLVLGRVFPDGPRLVFELTTAADKTNIYGLDVNHDIAADLTRGPTHDFGGVWSPDGSRMAFISDRDGQFQLYLLTLGVGIRSLDDHLNAPGYHPVWSPDDKSLAYEVDRGTNRDLYVINVDQPIVPDINPHVLTDSQADDRFPTWSPDGSQIAFVSWREGNAEIFAVHPDGSDLTDLTQNTAWSDSPSWSPDGSQIAFYAILGRFRELYVMKRDGSDVRQLTDAQDVNNGSYWDTPIWSADGRTIAFQMVVKGNPQIVVTTPQGSAPQDLTDDAAINARPLWLADGRLVFTMRSGVRSVLYVRETDGSLQALMPADVYSDNPAPWN